MPGAVKGRCRVCQRPSYEPLCGACKGTGLGGERRDPAIKKLYGSKRWRERSRAWLDEPGHHFCVGYPAGFHGERLVAAQVPDHKVAHKGDEALFWDEENWQPLCIPCNSRKAVREEGAGRRR